MKGSRFVSLLLLAKIQIKSRVSIPSPSPLSPTKRIDRNFLSNQKIEKSKRSKLQENYQNFRDFDNSMIYYQNGTGRVTSRDSKKGATIGEGIESF